MNKENLQKYSMLPRWRIPVIEASDEAGYRTRIYWEWCDPNGTSSYGESVNNGEWILFKDFLHYSSTATRIRVNWMLHADYGFCKVKKKG